MNHHNLYTRSSTGKLMVFCFEGNKVKPVIGATVTITGNNQNITLQTNESGQTPTVTLPAVFPYSKYTVNVSANGYSSSIIEGVQVVPNTTAIQEIQMTATRQRGDYRPTDDDIIPEKVPDQALTRPPVEKPVQDPLAIEDPRLEPQSRPDGPAIGLLIPEYIIVHDGAPKEPAKKYRVKFTDYITKVACGEIFSWYHKEALKANILCIISYTLNKVFTQAYEGFDVTSRIQFDHKYSHVQTHFPQIVEVVDAIFNQYVKHPDSKKSQPFLTEYRAWRKGRCLLGQNDSEKLAKQGYKHQDILKLSYNCYKPIAITSSPGVIFQGRPTPPPEKILQEGSSGMDVREIQVFLNYISKKYNKIPKIKEDGKFGTTTKKAVETFQKIFTIPPNGIVDFRTWYKISNLYYSILEYKE